jgi:hypothetical protein
MKRITKEQYRDSSSAASTAEVEPRPNEGLLAMTVKGAKVPRTKSVYGRNVLMPLPLQTLTSKV